MSQHNHLLIIDDDADMRALLRIYAEALGYAVTECGDAGDCIAEYDRTLPSVVMLDLSMPEKDGVVILRELANRGCKTPIIITSGMPDRLVAATRLMGAELGLDIPVCMPKPVTQHDMRKALTQTWNDAFSPTPEDIKAAIDGNEMIVHFQPKVKLDRYVANTIAGSEALVRWQHPRKGLQPPGNFIPVAEEAGLIGALTDTVLDSVIEQLKIWTDRGLYLPVSVNLSPSQLADLSLPDRLAKRMEDADIDTGLLVFEVTEQTVYPEASKAIDVLTRLRLKGFGLSLDDFGTGYSSIAEIYRLPLTEVKIDRSIVTAAETDGDARKIVHAIIELAHSFNLHVCAEGVETEAGETFLREAGCDLAQGFHFAKPMPPTHFQHFVTKVFEHPESPDKPTLRIA